MKWVKNACLLFALLFSAGLAAQCPTPQLGCNPYSVTFSGFAGNGFSTAPSGSQLCSNIWYVEGLSDGNGTFGGTHTSGDFARGNTSGGVSTGGVYSLNNGAIWFQPAGSDLTPGYIHLVIRNAYRFSD